MLLTRNDTGLQRRVRQIMYSGNQSFDNLVGSSSDIILFGSRAAGLERHNSDLDLLVIGGMRTRKRIGNLDLIFVPEQEIGTIIWQRTELFRHIEVYGVSLVHDRMLVTAVFDEYAARRKRERLRVLLARVVPSWNVLTDGFRLKYLVKLRREAQRYRILERGCAVPPTAELDSCMDSLKSIGLIFEDLFGIVGRTTDDADEAQKLLVNEVYRLRASLLRK